MSPFFTIAIPAWKTEFLGPALASAVGQDLSDLEVLVIDDCAPGDVAGVVRGFADPRVRLTRLDVNLGRDDPSRTWNVCLHQARGRFITLLGDDDLLDPNYCSEMASIIGRFPGSSIYRARLRTVDANSRLTGIGPWLPEVESWSEYMYFRNLGSRPQSTSEMCVSTVALRQLGGYVSMPLALGSDDLTWIRLCLDRPMVSTNGTWASWRNHPSSICGMDTQPMVRIEAFQKSLVEELRLIETRDTGDIPREILREATVAAWMGHIGAVRRRVRPRGMAKAVRLLGSIVLPSLAERHVRDWFRGRRDRNAQR